MSLLGENKGGVNDSDFSQRGTIRISSENVTLGLVGAFLGSLIGVAVIVVMNQLGYMTSFSGVILGGCTLVGYEKLGKEISKKGIILSIIVTIVMVYVAERINYAIIFMEYDIGILEAFKETTLMMKEYSELAKEFYANLFMLYFFTIMGLIPVVSKKIKLLEKSEQLQASNHQSYTQQENIYGDMNLYHMDQINIDNRFEETTVKVHYLNSSTCKQVLNIRRIMIVPTVFFVLSIMHIIRASERSAYASSYLFCVVLLFVIIFAIVLHSLKIFEGCSPCYVNENDTIWRVDWKYLYPELGLKSTVFGKNDPTTLMPEQRRKLEIMIATKIQNLKSGLSVYETGIYKYTDVQVMEKTKRSTNIICKSRGKQYCKKFSNGYDTLFGHTPTVMKVMPIGVKITLFIFIIMLLTATLAIFLLEENKEFQMDNIHFELADDFIDLGEGHYQNTSVSYNINYVLFDSKEEARDFVSIVFDEYLANDNIGQYDYEFGDDKFRNRVDDNGSFYEYNIVNITYDDNTNEYVGNVITDESQLIIISGYYDVVNEYQNGLATQIEEIIDSISVDSIDYVYEEEIPFWKENLADNKYLDYFDTDTEYTHLGLAYYKSPEAMFGEDNYMEAYLPIDGEIEYVDNGYGVKSKADGIETYYSIKTDQENSMELVDEVYQEMLITKDVIEEAVSDTSFAEEYLIAYKVVPYYEKATGEYKITFLYAQRFIGDYYRYSEITCIMNEYNDELQRLLNELSENLHIDFLSYLLEYPVEEDV